MKRVSVAPGRVSDKPAEFANVRKQHPKNTGTAAVWSQDRVDEARAWSQQQDLGYLAWCADLDGLGNGIKPPNWTQYNKHIRKDQQEAMARDIIPGKQVLYLTITDDPIDMDPPDAQTILAIIKKADERRKCAGKRAMLLIADAGELVRIIHQLFGSPQEDTLMPFPGGLHIVFMMMGAVEKMTEGAGVAQLLVGSGMMSSINNCKRALKGKAFNRGIEALKTLWEALGVLKLNKYVDHVAKHGGVEAKNTLQIFAYLIADIREGGKKARDAMSSDAFAKVLTSLDAWVKTLEKENGTTKFVGIMSGAIDVILFFIRCSRDCKKHGIAGWFGAVEAFYPYMAAANRNMYKRMLVVIRDLVRHCAALYGPELEEELRSGRALGLQRMADVFAMIWGDLNLEQKTNRWSKDMLQTFAARRNSMFAQLKALPERIRTIMQIQNWTEAVTRPGNTRRSKAPPKPWVSRTKLQAKNVAALTILIEDVVTVYPAVGDKDSKPNVIHHLTSNQVAPPLACASLLTALERANTNHAAWIQRYEQYDHNGDEGTEKSVTYSHPMTKFKLVTFSDAFKKKKVKFSDGKASQALTSYVLQVMHKNESLEVPVAIWDENSDSCLARYELGSYSHMLFDQGAYRKGNKAATMHAVCPFPPEYRRPVGASWVGEASIFDYAAILQKCRVALSGDEKWLVEMITASVVVLLNEARKLHGETLMLCCDSYPGEGSPKDLEAIARLKGRTLTRFKIIRGRSNPNPTPMLSPEALKDFLGDGHNKTQMVAHLREELLGVLNGSPAKYAVFKRVILVNAEGRGSWITIERGDGAVPWSVVPAPGLKLLYIEADQLLPAAAKWWLARASSTGAAIVCEDTDVHVAVFAYCSAIANGKRLTICKGKKGKKRRIDIVKSVEKFMRLHAKGGDNTKGEVLLSCLVAVYSATGSDTNGAPYGHPKPAIWARLVSLYDTHPELFESLALVGTYPAREGETLQMTTPSGDMVRDDLDMIMARLLGDHTAYSCDESRGVKLARSGIGVLKRTVPTSDTVRYQWYRADWQSEMWYLCIMFPWLLPPDPIGKGVDRGYRILVLHRGDERTELIGPTYKLRKHAPDIVLGAEGCRCNVSNRVKEPHHCLDEKKCPCAEAGVHCTDKCHCKGCKNCVQPTDQSTLEGDTAEYAREKRQQGGATDGVPPGAGVAVFTVGKLIEREALKHLRRKKNPNGARYGIHWEGHDAEGRPYGPSDSTVEVLDHSDPKNFSRCLHFNRLLDEYCTDNGVDQQTVHVSAAGGGIHTHRG